MRKTIAVCLGIIILSFFIGAYFYPLVPEKIPSHWNAQGEVDSYMDKLLGLFLMPIISLVFLLLFIVIPKMDPKKQNIEKFRNYYNGMVVVIIAFLFYIYLLTLAWTLGFTFNMMQMIVPAIGLLFIYMGFLVEHAKQNWFVGIRTPWTLSNKKVWEKTHRRGGFLFKIAGLIAILGIFFGKHAIWFVLVPIIIFVVYLFVYSYIKWKKIVSNK
jgi:uncharacterized membrane protein